MYYITTVSSSQLNFIIIKKKICSETLKNKLITCIHAVSKQNMRMLSTCGGKKLLPNRNDIKKKTKQKTGDGGNKKKKSPFRDEWLLSRANVTILETGFS